MQQLEGTSLDIKTLQLEKLKEIFPEAITEGEIDWEKLKLTLGDELVIANERYVLNWAGKTDAFRAIQTQTTGTLKPQKEQSVNFDTTENIFIEGENLEVLKVLQKSYYGKVKMIYIDPPYNTGNDSFIYPDKFSESKDEYLKRIGDKDEAGYLTKEGLFRKNSKESGQYHSNWLSMMYPRLFLARNLLREDGVIFVSIDDNEVHNLRLMMNEIFGEENFIDCIIWKKRYGGGAKERYLVSLHEYALMYAKNKESLDPLYIPSNPEDIERYYKLKDEKFEKRGPYRTHPMEATKSMGDRPNLVYPIPAPDGTQIMPKRQWLWSKERTTKALEKNELEFIKGKEGWTVHTKQYWKDENGKIRQSKAFSVIDDVYTQHGTNEIIEMFGDAQIFPFPKPTGLLKPLIQLGSSPDSEDIILDFFGGSGTTAQAVLELNKEDGGNRKFILVQLAEKTEEDSEAYKAGYKTITGICKERLRRACKKIKEEAEKDAGLFAEKKLDLGFKAFRLEPSNFKVWRTDMIESEDDLKKQMEAFVDPTRARSEADDMAWEILLKSGYELTTPMEKLEVASVPVYSISNGEVMVALEKISQEAINAIIAKKSATADKPKRVVCLDRLFAGNDQLKTNNALQMKDAGVEFRTI
ncbi:MAG: site-specific DNA-methyltransferase [Bacteroidota bacterium]